MYLNLRDLLPRGEIRVSDVEISRGTYAIIVVNVIL